jgi:hypothetical protein
MLPQNVTLDIALLLASLTAGALAIVVLSLEYFSSHSALARAFHQTAGRVLTPRVLWVSVLAASLIGSRYVAAHLLGSLHQGEQHAVDLQDLPVSDRLAFTDRGRPVSLFHFALHTPADEIELFMQSAEGNQRNVIRLADANPETNCHGWIFTAGEYGVRDLDVQAILDDNDYALVDPPRDGDVVVYRRNGNIVHAGLARTPQPQGPVLVESKWGAFGLYLHAPHSQPFAGDCTFYRSSRAGHAIRLSPRALPVSAE